MNKAKRFCILATEDDRSYIPRFKPLLEGAGGVINFSKPQYLTELDAMLRTFTAGITTSDAVLKLAIGARRKVTLDDYAGSIVKLPSGKELLVLNPLEHLVTTTTGPHLFGRYISKLTRPERWFVRPQFTWELAEFPKLDQLFQEFSSARLIAADIETSKDNLGILCISFCGVWINGNGNISAHTIVLPLDSLGMVAWASRFLELEVPKIFQNGMYDNAYLLRYGICTNNWLWDTQHLFHAWLSELPKRLDFITSYTLRDAEFWKDESVTGNKEDFFRYNAKDSYNTATSLLAILAEAPEWARSNYLKEFPKVFPCLSCALDGLKVDKEQQQKMKLEQEEILNRELASIQRCIGVNTFNPSSWQQVLRLVHALGNKDILSTDKKNIEIVKNRHPLHQFLFSKIQNYRGARKLLGTYVNVDLLHGRLLYSLNPAGTDTGRLASKESAFWCGTQIQNIPPYAKQMIIADDGFLLFEIDKRQSESRCTAYESQDENLIRVVETSPDFHSTNAELFFGIPFAELYDVANKKILNKPIHNLSKRTNHGANYNMRNQMLLDTMGEKNVLEAKRLLKLPPYFSLLDVTQYLLDRFDAIYPRVRGEWQEEIIAEVRATGMLVSSRGWTRRCFGKPWLNKLDLNAVIAHVSQNLSVDIVNDEFEQIFLKLQDAKNFRVKAQIHDSVFGEYRIGREDLLKRAEELMQTKVKVKGRVLYIPNDVKAGKRVWSELGD